jgi:hypothetical protein
MLEPGIDLPTAPAAPRLDNAQIDPRGWVMVLLALVLIGFVALRSPPQPTIPLRVANVAAETWMADALPGVGPKTRDEMLQHIRTGDFASLPNRAQAIADVVFTRPPIVAPGSAAR